MPPTFDVHNPPAGDGSAQAHDVQMALRAASGAARLSSSDQLIAGKGFSGSSINHISPKQEAACGPRAPPGTVKMPASGK